ncbi:hypothetical protein B0H66DRAFT_615546 [Apodospora peruviana]|uniref:Uncharacterized protein n=1 Tax=Apodospora peruviana TaxID=516989 RepID=A0AAE0IHA9_9PEZI|nr:hypothetical protein B0H66DRAFT_615546 [Apodospora peruviana]
MATSGRKSKAWAAATSAGSRHHNQPKPQQQQQGPRTAYPPLPASDLAIGQFLFLNRRGVVDVVGLVVAGKARGIRVPGLRRAWGHPVLVISRPDLEGVVRFVFCRSFHGATTLPSNEDPTHFVPILPPRDPNGNNGTTAVAAQAATAANQTSAVGGLTFRGGRFTDRQSWADISEVWEVDAADELLSIWALASPTQQTRSSSPTLPVSSSSSSSTSLLPPQPLVPLALDTRSVRVLRDAISAFRENAGMPPLST